MGSVAGCLSYRLPRGIPVILDRSRCPACGTVLAARDLIPVLSWLLHKARCRHCGGAVSPRYPLVEIVTALLFVLAFRCAAGDLPIAVITSVGAFALVVIALTDWETRIIPDAMLLLLLPVVVAWRWSVGGDWADGLAGACLAVAVGGGLRWAFRRWRGKDGLGFGDVKFLAVAGLAVGLSGLGGYLVACGLAGIVFGAVWRAAGRGAVFPFGPALSAGLLAGLLMPDLFSSGLFAVGSF